MALTNDQIAELLSEGTGQSITPGTLVPTAGSKRIDWQTLQERAELGLPINEGELLPLIPEGVSSSDFFRLTGISPTVFNLDNFSTFENSIARPNNPSSITEDAPVTSNIEKVPVRQERQSIVDNHTGNDFGHDGPGPQALAGVSLASIFSGVGGAISQMLDGTPFLDYTHMIDPSLGGTTTDDTTSLYVNHNGKRISMNETLWRDWDNLHPSQKDLMAKGVYQMAKAKDGTYYATNGKRFKNPDGKYEMVRVDADSYATIKQAQDKGYGGFWSPGYNQYGLMGGPQEIADAGHKGITSFDYGDGSDPSNRGYFGAGQSSAWLNFEWG